MKRAISAITILLVMAMLSGCALNLKSKDQFYEDNVKDKILQELTNDYGTIYDMNALKETVVPLQLGVTTVFFLAGSDAITVYAKALGISPNTYYSGSINSKVEIESYIYDDFLNKERVDKYFTYSEIDNNGFSAFYPFARKQERLFIVLKVTPENVANLTHLDASFKL